MPHAGRLGRHVLAARSHLLEAEQLRTTDGATDGSPRNGGSGKASTRGVAFCLRTGRPKPDVAQRWNEQAGYAVVEDSQTDVVLGIWPAPSGRCPSVERSTGWLTPTDAAPGSFWSAKADIA